MPQTSPARTDRPRRVLPLGIVVLAGVLGLFFFLLNRAQDNAERDIEERFHERAVTSAGLTEGLLLFAGVANAERYGREYGGAIDRDDLETEVRQRNLVYAAILDADGRILARTRGASAAALARLEGKPPIVRAGLAGKTLFSDAIARPGGGVIESATPYSSRDGRRVFVSASPLNTLAELFKAQLARVPHERGAQSYILDSSDAVVGTTGAATPGRRLADRDLLRAIRTGADGGAFDGRFFTRREIKGSNWQVVLEEPQATLYELVRGDRRTVPWVIFGVLSLVALAALSLVWQLSRRSTQLAVVNRGLAVANSTLEERTAELERSNRELDQFASIASHDLREPLRKVQTFGDRLAKNHADRLPPEGLDDLRRMQRGAARMGHLIEDLLVFSRVSTRAQRFEEVDLAESAHTAIEDLEQAIADADATVEVGELPTIEADSLQMRQLMQNLIGNAVKFGREGVPPRVTVSGGIEPNGAGDGAVPTTVIEVSDNGIGFEEGYGERIFRVFERLHPVDVYEGTGIGLALCRKIAERHGGRIDATSEPGQGSVFTVRIPSRQGAGPHPRRVEEKLNA